LPDGDKHEVYKQQLDHIAGYFNNLKDDMGRHIPIIFRPFHENTGSWFWWGAKHCTPDEYKALWRFTVEYLRDVKQVHNLLWAYSPSKPTQQSEGYLVRYPGDVWVDIIGADHYRPLNKDSWPEALLLDARLLVRLAEKRGKVAAITEAGISKGLANANSDDVFTQKILEPIKNDPVAKHLAYFMTWRNQNRNSNDKYWIPVEGDSLLPDFIKFHADPFMLFEDNIPDMYRMPK